MQELGKSNRKTNNMKQQILAGPLLLVIVAVLILLYLNQYANCCAPCTGASGAPVLSEASGTDMPSSLVKNHI